jgi:hypothetical protein
MPKWQVALFRTNARVEHSGTLWSAVGSLCATKSCVASGCETRPGSFRYAPVAFGTVLASNCRCRSFQIDAPGCRGSERAGRNAVKEFPLHVNPEQASKVKSRMPIHQRTGEGRRASIRTEVFDAIRRGSGNGTHARLHTERGRSRSVAGGASDALRVEQRFWRRPVGKSERPVVVVMAGKAGPAGGLASPPAKGPCLGKVCGGSRRSAGDWR